MSIRTRLWLMVTALLAAVLLGNAVVVIGMEKRELKRSLERESLTFARLAGPQALRAFGESGRRVSPKFQRQLAEIARGLPALEAFGLFSARGRRVLTVHPAGSALEPVAEDEEIPEEGLGRYLEIEGDSLYVLTVPTHTVEGGPSVYVKVLVSGAEAAERLERITRAYLASLAVLLLLGAALAAGLARSILGPVEKLKSAAVKIRDGDLGVRVGHSGSGELAALTDAFDAMAEELELHRHMLEHRNEELESAYAELQALQDELANLESVAAAGRTAAAVSHEIDNPIGVILGTAETLKRELAANAEQLEDLELIESECKRCRRIVRDLLALARPAGGASGPVALENLLSPVLRALRHHPSFKGVSLEANWAEAMPAAVADPDAVKQVALNLLLNAARAVRRAQAGGRVQVEGGFDERWVFVTVSDDGPGIPSDEQERIFEPFYTTADKEGGSGLGLAVSRRIVEEQGGRLTVESPLGGRKAGSAFTARWPRQGSDDAAA